MKKKLIQIRATEDEIEILNLLANIRKCSKSEVIRNVFINYALNLSGLNKNSNIQSLIRELRNISISVYEIREIITKIYDNALNDKFIVGWPVVLEEDKSDLINLHSNIDEINDIGYVRIEDLKFAFMISLIDNYVIAKTDFRDLILKFAFNKKNIFCFILTFDENTSFDNEKVSSTFFEFTIIREDSFEKFKNKISETLETYCENNKDINFINSFGENIKFPYFLRTEIWNIFNSLKIYE